MIQHASKAEVCCHCSGEFCESICSCLNVHRYMIFALFIILKCVYCVKQC